MSVKELCDLVRQTAFDIHVFHGHGQFEKIYENALSHRLIKLGLQVERQHAIHVFDEDGTPLGDYVAELLIENYLLVELKVAKDLNADHEGQILGYLRATRRKHGLLINFGSPRFQIRKFIND